MCVTEASLAGLLAALQATHARVEAECGELQGDLARLGQVSSDWSVVGHVTSILTSDWPGDPAPAAAGRRGSDEGCRHSGREVGMDGLVTGRKDHWPMFRNSSLQKQLDSLRKSSRDARQVAGAFRMSRGGAPYLVRHHT